jgi:hypothetical protein
MYISVSYFAGILVALVCVLPVWVSCYELLHGHVRYNRVGSRDVVIMWFMENSRVVL